jgi:hypothetical protein
MKVLRRGDQGPDARAWQNFLIGQEFDPKGADGKLARTRRLRPALRPSTT